MRGIAPDPCRLPYIVRMEHLDLSPPSEWPGERVREFRERREMEREELAQYLGYSSTETVRSIEGGRRNPSGAARRLLDLMDAGVAGPLDGLPSRETA